MPNLATILASANIDSGRPTLNGVNVDSCRIYANRCKTANVEWGRRSFEPNFDHPTQTNSDAATLRRSALDIGSVDALYLTAEELSDFSAGMARACIGVAAEVLAELDREADSLPRSHVRR